MTLCQELSDRMPAVARGEAAWTPAEAAHLEGCAECRAEFAIVRAGVGVAPEVLVDVDRVAASVVHRLRTEPIARQSRRPFWLVAAVAAAAAVMLVLVPERAPEGAAPVEVDQSPYAVHVPGLDGLSEAGLTELLQSLDARWTDVPTIDSPSLDDLDPRELEQLQRPWES